MQAEGIGSNDCASRAFGANRVRPEQPLIEIRIAVPVTVPQLSKLILGDGQVRTCGRKWKKRGAAQAFGDKLTTVGTLEKVKLTLANGDWRPVNENRDESKVIHVSMEVVCQPRCRHWERPECIDGVERRDASKVGLRQTNYFRVHRQFGDIRCKQGLLERV